MNHTVSKEESTKKVYQGLLERDACRTQISTEGGGETNECFRADVRVLANDKLCSSYTELIDACFDNCVQLVEHFEMMQYHIPEPDCSSGSCIAWWNKTWHRDQL